MEEESAFEFQLFSILDFIAVLLVILTLVISSHGLLGASISCLMWLKREFESHLYCFCLLLGLAIFLEILMAVLGLEAYKDELLLRIKQFLEETLTYHYRLPHEGERPYE